MIQQQWQGLLRLALAAGGTWLINHGVTTAGDWASVSPFLFTGIGAFINAGVAWWSFHSHKADTIIATADKLKENGK